MSNDTSTWDPEPPRQLTPFGDLVDGVLSGIGSAPGGGGAGSVLRLRAAWRDVVGPKLADRCAPVELAAAKLVIEVADGATASLLRYETGHIARRASDVLGSVAVDAVALRVRR